MSQSLRPIYNLIILDESGSMQSVKTVTLNGFNETVQTIRAAQRQFPEQQHFVTLVTFNGTGIKTLLDKQPVEELSELTAESYLPNASTPLYDAIGKSLMRLEFQTEQEKEYSVLVSILTDGEENSSREFKGTNIKAMIQRLKEKDWAFTYMGANHAVEQVAKSMDIDSFTQFESNEEDMKGLFKKESLGRMSFYNKIYQGQSSKDAMKDFWDKE
ncbi:vWA domain-containing protein [Telluribacter sp.]|jgi:uncharacterized protein YegL|uniref:vWA domain-containing protein n=1 Tax=Telluribacter sp. TaxID=1978767 RepID=UPI002E0E3523|nr:vWA domain-containing protein [Telluribacter sp.]